MEREGGGGILRKREREREGGREGDRERFDPTKKKTTYFGFAVTADSVNVRRTNAHLHIILITKKKGEER
jgi:hypothetical protein